MTATGLEPTVEQVHEGVLPENEYESEGTYFGSENDFLYVFLQVIKMKRKYLKVSQKVAITVLTCGHLNIAGNT